MSTDTLVSRIAALRFFDIVKVTKAAAPNGRLNMDPNRRFQGDNSKTRFAEWAVENLPHAALENALATMDFKPAVNRNVPIPPTRRTVAQTEPTPATLQQEQTTMTTVTNAPTPQAATDAAGDLAAALARIMAGTTASVDPEQVRAIAEAVCAEKLRGLTLPRGLAVTVTNGPTVTTVELPRQHPTFDALMAFCAARDRRGNRFNVWLAGPAGSGKTTAAESVATALGLPFYESGSVDADYKLMGFINVGGYQTTEFRKAYEGGGVFLLDEADGCTAGALLAMNAALANGRCTFPDGPVRRHPDCIIIAAANTWGNGATFEYVGREQLDKASMDRFKPMAWDYDTEGEMINSGNEEWCRKVQRWRANCRRAGIEHIISPRATYDGADLLKAGVPEAQVIAACVRKGLSNDQWDAIK